MPSVEQSLSIDEILENLTINLLPLIPNTLPVLTSYDYVVKEEFVFESLQR